MFSITEDRPGKGKGGASRCSREAETEGEQWQAVSMCCQVLLATAGKTTGVE